MTTGLTAQIIDLGRSAGLDAVGVAPATILDRARVELFRRKAEGLHDSMKFTYKNPERSTNPRASMPEAQSVVVAAYSYLEQEPAMPEGPAARVARYAWRDHYAPLRAGLAQISQRLRAEGFRTVVYADDNGLVDREIAYRAGIGWFGKNANLLLPGRGSYFVLGSVVTTAALELTAEPMADGCGGCKRCLDSCPTDAIAAPGVIDARRCLAWLAQRPGVFPHEFREALGVRIYGCDACQEICPPNIRFGRPVERDTPAAWLDLVELLSIDDATLLARHGRWYIADRDPRWVRRNALVCLGNAGVSSEEVRAVLVRYLAGMDDMLRSHAAWAVVRLGFADLAALLTTDASAEVRAEVSAMGVPR
jgi:epoxyqueuosine reductase